jgi:hypothetical protein
MNQQFLTCFPYHKNVLVVGDKWFKIYQGMLLII